MKVKLYGDYKYLMKYGNKWKNSMLKRASLVGDQYTLIKEPE